MRNIIAISLILTIFSNSYVFCYKNNFFLAPPGAADTDWPDWESFSELPTNNFLINYANGSIKSEDLSPMLLKVISDLYESNLPKHFEGEELAEMLRKVRKRLLKDRIFLKLFNDPAWLSLRLEKFQLDAEHTDFFESSEIEIAQEEYRKQLAEARTSLTRVDQEYFNFIRKFHLGNTLMVDDSLKALNSPDFFPELDLFQKAMLEELAKYKDFLKEELDFNRLKIQFQVEVKSLDYNSALCILARINVIDKKHLNLRQQIERAKFNVVLRDGFGSFTSKRLLSTFKNQLLLMFSH